MYKAKPFFHSGQAMVQLSGLPNNQYDFLSRNIPADHMIKVTVEEDERELCVNYEDYEYCFQLFQSENYESYFDSQI
jgi:hypothetical protein